jgi:hypothetical protein
MKSAPERYRLIKHSLLGSDSSYGNNGFFIIPHYKIADYELRCQISDGEGWEHVSVTVGRKREDPSRCPTWTEMCFIKDLFWNKDETVIQLHPPESEYVNMHPFCLHLWKPIEIEIPLPPNIFVGIKS